MLLKDYNGPDVPLNEAGDTYPSQYTGEGTGQISIDDTNGVDGSSLALALSDGVFYAQFNPYAENTRGFARDYCEDPEGWLFNTYNRLVFWARFPTIAQPLLTTGQNNMNVGTYVKTVIDPDLYSDETGGGHWYHAFNMPNLDTWTKCIVNMHPNHLRDADGGLEHGDQPHPTGEEDYNYFDALTRFYVSQQNQAPESYPAVLHLDEFWFHQEIHPENDDQIYSIAATYVPADNRIILTWNRHKDENDVVHCVRYAFENIHTLGFDNATEAPDGCLSPPGWQGYNGMLYQTTFIDVTGQDTLFLAIKPDNATRFSQMDLQLIR